MVVQEARQHFRDYFVPERRILNWEGDFYPSNKVSWHPIRAGEKDLLFPSVFEIVNPTVFKETSYNANDSNVLAQIWNLWTQTTNAANDQVNFHPGAGSLVKFLDDFLIHE